MNYHPLQNKADLKLQLGNLTTRHTFYLADIADEYILGMDYLQELSMSPPPNSEAVIPVKLAEQEKVWKPGWGMLHSSNAYSKNGLLVGCTLVDLNHEVLPVRVLNVTTVTQKINKGSDSARCELVDEVVGEECPHHSNKHGELPDHVKSLFERSAKNLSTAEQKELWLTCSPRAPMTDRYSPSQN